MNVISDMGSHRLAKSSEELQPNVMSNRELEKGKESFGNPFKSGVSPYRIINIWPWVS